jgi:hypothetical protein
MFDIKEASLVELYDRIKFYRSEFQLKTCKRNPDRPVNEYAYPAVFIISGKDNVIEHSSRNSIGYPAKRSCVVSVEFVANNLNTDIKELFYNVRKAIFTKHINDSESSFKITPILVVGENKEHSFIRESDYDGPFSLQIPEVSGMTINFDLFYTDIGIGINMT